MLTPEEKQQLKREMLQELIQAMNDAMAEKFKPKAVEIQSVEGEIATPEGEMEFGPEVSVDVEPADEMGEPMPPMPEFEASEEEPEEDMGLDKVLSSMPEDEEEEEDMEEEE